MVSGVSGGMGSAGSRQDLPITEGTEGTKGTEGAKGAEDQAERDGFARAIARALVRIERRLDAIEGDRVKAEAAKERAERARLFVASAASAPRGTRVLQVVDWTTGAPETIEMAFDPSKTAADQLTALFRHARRLTAGALAARDRAAATEVIAKGLREIAISLADPTTDLASLEARALSLAPRDFTRAVRRVEMATKPRHKVAPRLPYRKFIGASGRFILVGRDAASNDELTLHVARPRDLWLHARNWAGAHVVVPLDKGASCPANVLVQAAHLAVHFSDARAEPLVEVTYAPRRFVRKPRGSAPGSVVVDREKVLALRKEDAVLRKLLESEVEL